MTEKQERFAAIRSQFAGTNRGPYCDVAARGLMLSASRASLERHLDDASEGTIDKSALFRQAERTRALLACLIGSTPETIAYTRNVTDGIATFAASLDWRPGDSVVLCEELEHPANIYPWYGVSRKFGIRVKNVPQSGGAIAISRILEAIDPSCRVVAVSSVSFAPGFRFPVAELAAECRKRGVLLVVDAAQSIGVSEIDVADWDVDALAMSTQKGLMSLYGMGFLYVRPELAETMKPIFLSRFGVSARRSRGEPGRSGRRALCPRGPSIRRGQFQFSGSGHRGARNRASARSRPAHGAGLRVRHCKLLCRPHARHRPAGLRRTACDAFEPHRHGRPSARLRSRCSPRHGNGEAL